MNSNKLFDPSRFFPKMIALFGIGGSVLLVFALILLRGFFSAEKDIARQAERNAVDISSLAGSETPVMPTSSGAPITSIISMNTAELLEPGTTVWEKGSDSFSLGNSPVDAGIVVADSLLWVADTEGKVTCVQLTSGTVVWQVNLETSFAARPLIGRSLFLVSLAGDCFALDPQTGATRWKTKLGGAVNSPISEYRDSILVADQSGKLLAIRQSTGQIEWTYQCADQIQTEPVVSDGCCFIAGCDGQLHIIDAQTGAGIDKIDLESPTGCTPIVRGSIAWVGTEGNSFMAIDLKERKIVWQFSTKQAIRGRPALSGDTICFGTQGGEIVALNAITGELLWRERIKSRIDAPIVSYEDQFVVVSYTGLLCFLDAATGEFKRREQLAGYVVAPPVPEGEKLYIATDEGTICRLSLNP